MTHTEEMLKRLGFEPARGGRLVLRSGTRYSLRDDPPPHLPAAPAVTHDLVVTVDPATATVEVLTFGRIVRRYPLKGHEQVRAIVIASQLKADADLADPRNMHSEEYQYELN